MDQIPGTDKYWCDHCHGKGSIQNQYQKSSPCLYCAGYGTVKICPDCNQVMPIYQNRCYNCILKLDEIEDI